ncbi:MAG: glycosyl hydrolase family 30 [Mucilaginibacter sp.]|nr:glycosyl hydrolase family 30 [Mucilaginibacter sp.]
MINSWSENAWYYHQDITNLAFILIGKCNKSIVNKKKINSLLFFIFTAISIGYGQKIQWVSSLPAAQWTQEKELTFKSPNSEQPTLTIYPEQQLQRIDGFGGCFNEIGWEALASLNAGQRNKILQELFATAGANFSICRMPIGASDYALSWYSLDDVPDDFTMRNFNIDRDRYILIPYIHAAQKIHPSLKIWASPWSPPVWMKVNNHYALTSGGVKGMKRGDNEMGILKNIGDNATAFKMENSYLEAYALYFSRFVKAYKKEGIDISAINVQNEVVYAPQWPSCTWRPEDLALFIRKYLGPKFKTDSISTDIWLGTINNGNPDYVRRILTDTATSKYIKGVGLQWAGKKAISAISKEFPKFELMQTESECGEGENNWASAEHTWTLLQHYLTNGANSYMYWNMVLDSSGESSWGWPQNMLISINKQSGEIRYNPEFYLMKHLSHFVMPGAYRIQTSGGNDHLAFINPDGTVTLLMMNSDQASKQVVLRMNGKSVILSLKPKSFNTFSWKL